MTLKGWLIKNTCWILQVYLKGTEHMAASVLREILEFPTLLQLTWINQGSSTVQGISNQAGSTSFILQVII